MEFAGKVALVTGGATGIGYAIAGRFARAGAKVVLVGRREEVGKQAEAKLREEGLEAAFVRGDVADEASVQAFVGETVRRYGRLDILVNNAAVSDTRPFLSPDTVKWRQVFNVTADGTYLCSRIAAQHMVDAGIKGCIINISSINSSRALRDSSHYNAAKGAMDQLTRCMALELADHGIRVNGINPGFIETELSVVDGVNELETEWFTSIYVGHQKIAQRRAGQPDEIAGVAVFLASEAASYICGASIPVDGGLSITF